MITILTNCWVSYWYYLLVSYYCYYLSISCYYSIIVYVYAISVVILILLMMMIFHYHQLTHSYYLVSISPLTICASPPANATPSSTPHTSSSYSPYHPPTIKITHSPISPLLSSYYNPSPITISSLYVNMTSYEINISIESIHSHIRICPSGNCTIG